MEWRGIRTSERITGGQHEDIMERIIRKIIMERITRKIIMDARVRRHHGR